MSTTAGVWDGYPDGILGVDAALHRNGYGSGDDQCEPSNRADESDALRT